MKQDCLLRVKTAVLERPLTTSACSRLYTHYPKRNGNDRLLIGVFCRCTQLFSTNQMKVICWKTKNEWWQDYRSCWG